MNYKQIIYFGAPGTGKSFYVKNLLRDIANENIFRTTIHPEFTYSDFVGQLLPESVGRSRMGFKFKAGPFTNALKKAYSDSSKNVYLVLEELSRGNVAAIFGDIFQLLDRNQFFESMYTIRNKNIADQIQEILGDEIKLPSNFNIIGTVNTNDQSVYPIDTAFKRRFEWEYVSVDPATDIYNETIKELNNPKIIVDKSENKNEAIEMSWQAFYTSLNRFITDRENGLGRNEDRQIGQFFLEFNERLIEKSYSSDPIEAELAQKSISHIIKNKLLLYLWQDVQGSSYNNNSIFDNSVNSFNKLYGMYGNNKVFSERLINQFLEPDKNNFRYR